MKNTAILFVAVIKSCVMLSELYYCNSIKHESCFMIEFAGGMISTSMFVVTFSDIADVDSQSNLISAKLERIQGWLFFTIEL